MGVLRKNGGYMNLRHLTKYEIEEIIDNCCLNTELSRILQMLTRGMSIPHIAMDTGLSEAAVSRRIREIKNRISRI